jgi:glycosyltransferase involved in cell wall biosynthesis
VVVTEHWVVDRAHPWEQVATVLVSHSHDGAHELSRRWPRLRVEALPAGCPGWIGSRRRARGRTLALIGWPRRERGWWSALEVLERHPGTRLLALRRGGPEAAWQSWRRSASGLPVKVVEVSSARAAGEEAAAHADLAVLWHNAEPGLGTSYEARVAISSGLPVVTSTAPQFGDLEDAVFRPADLAEGVVQALEDDELRDRLIDAAERFCLANSWARVAERHLALWSSLGCA